MYKRQPLVEAEIVDYDKAHLFASIDMRENLRFENLVAHERVVVGSDPLLIVALHHFGERAVGLLLLHTQYVGHAGFGVGEREFPPHQRVVELIPVVDGSCHGYLLADAHKLLLIVARGFLRHQRLAVQVFLDGKQNLHRVHRLNPVSYTHLVGKYLKKHHKRLIGWDEILEGGIGREAVIMSWRGVKGGITAAKAGNLVIMAPNTHMYLNHYQSNMLFEPLAHGRVASLEWVYSFNPIPDVLTPEEAKKVLGIQGNVWTEYLPTYQLVEYMAYPRASAVAEIGWSQPENRNWKDYLKRLQIQFERWRYYQVNCALHYKLP